jgi:Ca-activated chloride channel homolog
LKLRYKEPDGKKSKLIEQLVYDKTTPFDAVSENLKLSSAVAEFGLLLRNSDFKGKATFAHVIETAKKTLTNDSEGWRAEFIQLVKKAQLMSEGKDMSKAGNKN